MILTILSAIAIGMVCVVGWDFYRCYRKSTNHGWQRIWDAGHGSATLVVQQIGFVVAGLTLSADKISDWVTSMLNDPTADAQIKSLIHQYVNSTSVGIAMAIYIGLTVWARLRTLNQAS